MTTTDLKKDRVLSYENDGIVKKYSRDYNVSINTARDRFEELKKFLFICKKYEGSFSPSKVIDDIWHTFILFTKDYQIFCSQYLGGFIHHSPDIDISEKSKKANNRKYRNLYTNLVHEFGVPSEDCWHIPVKQVSLSVAGDCTGDGGDGNCSGGQGDCGGHSCSPDSSCSGDE